MIFSVGRLTVLSCYRSAHLPRILRRGHPYVVAVESKLTPTALQRILAGLSFGFSTVVAARIISTKGDGPYSTWYSPGGCEGIRRAWLIVVECDKELFSAWSAEGDVPIMQHEVLIATILRNKVSQMLEVGGIDLGSSGHHHGTKDDHAILALIFPLFGTVLLENLGPQACIKSLAYVCLVCVQKHLTAKVFIQLRRPIGIRITVEKA